MTATPTRIESGRLDIRPPKPQPPKPSATAKRLVQQHEDSAEDVRIFRRRLRMSILGPHK